MATPQPIQLQPGQQPTPQQIQAIQQQIAAEAAKQGLTVQQYIEQMKAQAARQQAMMQQQRQQQGQGGPQQQGPQQQQGQGGPPQQRQMQQQPLQPGPPKPEALAVANFLKNQPLKTRTCLFQEKRKDMFKVKRAIRALQSPAYAKARKKNPLLPEVNDRPSAENTFKLLPLSLLALRVSKIDPHEGHDHGKKKRVKGLWNVKIEQQQDADDMSHYVWLYEGSQWRQYLMAAGALVAIMAVVMFPLWPYYLRLGAWYISVGCLGILGAFFGLAIVRLILFIITMFAAPPGFWLFPNLFEDVGFFDSFKPTWAWQETAEDKQRIKAQKKAKREERKARREGRAPNNGDAKAGQEAKEETNVGKAVEGEARASGAEVEKGGQSQARNMNARVEEVEDE
ncbi:translocation protein [Viridothelium virens]|uniref:Translocation protein SEC62 n=1 Tax=Viridothelium virens TaxID=1048519 RepID=A0A6A6H4V1_VIRVR|nr:translocation protein [Viridothelium virens]